MGCKMHIDISMALIAARHVHHMLGRPQPGPTFRGPGMLQLRWRCIPTAGLIVYTALCGCVWCCDCGGGLWFFLSWIAVRLLLSCQCRSPWPRVPGTRGVLPRRSSPGNHHQGPRGNKPAGSGLALRTGASSSPLSKPSPRQLSLGAWVCLDSHGMSSGNL